jgi:hypothetical protein
MKQEDLNREVGEFPRQTWEGSQRRPAVHSICAEALAWLRARYGVTDGCVLSSERP